MDYTSILALSIAIAQPLQLKIEHICTKAECLPRKEGNKLIMHYVELFTAIAKLANDKAKSINPKYGIDFEEANGIIKKYFNMPTIKTGGMNAAAGAAPGAAPGAATSTALVRRRGGITGTFLRTVVPSGTGILAINRGIAPMLELNRYSAVEEALYLRPGDVGLRLLARAANYQIAQGNHVVAGIIAAELGGIIRRRDRTSLLYGLYTPTQMVAIASSVAPLGKWIGDQIARATTGAVTTSAGMAVGAAGALIDHAAAGAQAVGSSVSNMASKGASALGNGAGRLFNAAAAAVGIAGAQAGTSILLNATESVPPGVSNVTQIAKISWAKWASTGLQQIAYDATTDEVAKAYMNLCMIALFIIMIILAVWRNSVNAPEYEKRDDAETEYIKNIFQKLFSGEHAQDIMHALQAGVNADAPDVGDMRASNINSTPTSDAELNAMLSMLNASFNRKTSTRNITRRFKARGLTEHPDKLPAGATNENRGRWTNLSAKVDRIKEAATRRNERVRAHAAPP